MLISQPQFKMLAICSPPHLMILVFFTPASKYLALKTYRHCDVIVLQILQIVNRIFKSFSRLNMIDWEIKKTTKLNEHLMVSRHIIINGLN